MNEDTLNLSIRKFLKKVGINSQREIEKAVRNGVQVGQLSGSETLKAKMTLELPELGLSLTIDGDIELE